jgi:hypothetical protein
MDLHIYIYNNEIETQVSGAPFNQVEGLGVERGPAQGDAAWLLASGVGSWPFPWPCNSQ